MAVSTPNEEKSARITNRTPEFLKVLGVGTMELMQSLVPPPHPNQDLAATANAAAEAMSSNPISIERDAVINLTENNTLLMESSPDK